jgi:APA family basic amino acid/polyamine antiporter
MGIASSVFLMTYLPLVAWERLGIWMAIGLVIYFAYGFWHSALRKA